MALTLRESGVESFVPRAWVLPADGAALEAHLAQRQKIDTKPPKKEREMTNEDGVAKLETFLIVKPVNGSQGRGISLCPPDYAAVRQATRGGTKEVIVQEYIADPLLIDERKVRSLIG